MLITDAAYLPIKQYYLNSLSMIIYLTNKQTGALIPMTGEVASGGIKLNKDDDTFAITFTVSQEDGQVTFSKNYNDIIAVLNPGQTYYWDFRISNRTYIAGEYIPTTTTNNQINTFNEEVGMINLTVHQINLNATTAQLAGIMPMVVPLIGTPNNSLTVFTMPSLPVTNKEVIIRGGVIQRRGIDYTISGATITFATAPETDTGLYTIYIEA